MHYIGYIFLSTGYKLIVRNLLYARGSKNHTIIVPSCDINLFVSNINDYNIYYEGSNFVVISITLYSIGCSMLNYQITVDGIFCQKRFYELCYS